MLNYIVFYAIIFVWNELLPFIIDKFEESKFFPKEIPYTITVCSPEIHNLSYLWYITTYTIPILCFCIVKKWCAMCRFSVNKCCLRDVSERFGVGLTTQYCINNIVMDFLIDICSTYIHFNEGFEKLAHEFQKIS